MARTILTTVLLLCIGITTCGADADLFKSLDLLIRMTRPGFTARSQPKLTPPEYRSGVQSRFWPVLREAGSRYQIDPLLLRSIVRHESNFDPKAVSHVGAMGLMQLMPKTAKMVGVSDPFDPKQNIHGGTRYLRYLLNKFNGNLYSSVLAYHAGPGNVRRGTAPQESLKYADRVLNTYQQLKYKHL